MAGLRVGDVLQGRYSIEGILGEGGMGAVYKASDLKIHRVWAIKEMTDNFQDPGERREALEGFTAECNILASLDHPNLPQIGDFFSENGRQYLVMELVEGNTLEKLLSQKGRLSVDETLEIARQLTDVLGYLHEQPQPIIFRDLKPANIIITSRGIVKLIDFGIARFFRAGKKTDTRALGTPGYAAPEQYGSGQTDARSDIYALGATLHQALTGINPSIQPFNFAPVSSAVPNIPPALDNVIAKAVAIDRNSRFSSAREFYKALECVKKAPASSAYAGYGATAAVSGAAFGAGGYSSGGMEQGYAQNGYKSGNVDRVYNSGGLKSGNIDRAYGSGRYATSIMDGANGYNGGAKPGYDPGANGAGGTGGFQSVRSQSGSQNIADSVSFNTTRIDFGQVQGSGKVKDTVILKGAVKGMVTSSDPRWLRVSPGYVNGADVPLEVTVDPNALTQEGRYDGTIRYKDSTVAVSVAVEHAKGGCWLMGAGVLFMLGSGIPYLNFLFVALSWILYAFNTRKKESKTLRNFAFVSLGLFGLMWVLVFALGGFLSLVSIFLDLNSGTAPAPSPAPYSYSTPYMQSTPSPNTGSSSQSAGGSSGNKHSSSDSHKEVSSSGSKLSGSASP